MPQLPNNPDPLQSPALEHRTLLLLVVAASVAFVLILLPQVGALLWALFIAITFEPMHRRTLHVFKTRRSLAALVTLLVIVVIVILPLVLVGASVVDQGSRVVERFRAGEIDYRVYFQRAMDVMPAWAHNLLERFGLGELGAVQRKLADGFARSGQALTTQVLGLGQYTVDFIVGFFVMLYVLYFLLRDGDELSRRVARAVPLHPHQTKRLLGQFATVVRATVKGNIVIALIQGTLGGLAFWVLGLPVPLLWGALMAVLSLLPAVGAALVWTPVALYFLATGKILAALGLTAWGVVVIGLVDNLLRPLLVGRDTRMPDYLVLVSTLGGIAVFGLNGFVVGPVIAALFLVAWDLFATVRANHTEGDSLASETHAEATVTDASPVLPAPPRKRRVRTPRNG